MRSTPPPRVEPSEPPAGTRPFARVLTAEAGASLRERLDEVLVAGDVDAALAAAGTAVVADRAGPAAGTVARALQDARAFAAVRGERLIATGVRDAFAAAAEHANGDARSLAAEMLRAFDADRARTQSVRLGRHVLDVRGGALVMAILNVTPDSFYDRGRFRGVDRARERATELVALGAAVIDIGGQSYAHWNPRIDAREERERVVPVVEALVRDGIGVPLSIDTWKADVADAALAAGASLINDCSGLADPRMAAVVARADASLVVMHLRGELNVRNAEAYAYADVMGEIVTFLHERTAAALADGVARDALIVDPGLEFGKEPAADLEILERFGDLRALGFPILFAASRKSFIGRVFDLPAQQLLVPSLATAALGIGAGASLVRVHDVAETAQVAAMLAATRRSQRRSLRLAARMPGTPA